VSDQALTPQRRLRADARENRARVLEAAAVAFAQEGLSVPLDEIARRAGVGAGTVYRHFPTKEELFEAVTITTVEALIARARELAQAPDPGEAFFAFFSELVDTAASSKALLEKLGGGIDLNQTAVGGAGQELKHSLAGLFEQAQQNGAVRSDLSATELNALVRGALAMQQDAANESARRRVLSVITDGLRATS
jgi:AcrR family transcriptional regulator